MRKLASVQRITDIRDVAGTEFLQVARVLGWNVIINKKQGLSVGDLVVYIEVDSQVPEWEVFEFMRAKHFKVKTMKMKGEYSQGLVMPLNIIPGSDTAAFHIEEGQDITKELAIVQFNEQKPVRVQGGKIMEKRIYRFQWVPVPVMCFLYTYMYWLYKLLTMNAGETYPPFVPKTDETRVQLLQPLLNKYEGTKCYITEKMDGQSWTGYLYKDRYGVCSRRIDLELNNKLHPHVSTAIKLGMEDKLEELNLVTGYEWALQGELVGPGIHGNKLKLEERDIYFFNAFNITKQRYADLEEFKGIIHMLGLKTVPILTEDYTLGTDIDTLVDITNGHSVVTSGVKREGIVIRPTVDTLDLGQEGLIRGRVSFKAINPEWLVEYKE